MLPPQVPGQPTEVPACGTTVAATSPAGAALCDLCRTDPHPESTCPGRLYRALVRAAAGGHHFCDAIHSRIVAGEMAEADGLGLLRRMLERAAAHKDTHGLTGSVTDLEDDVAAGRPLTRYR